MSEVWDLISDMFKYNNSYNKSKNKLLQIFILAISLWLSQWHHRSIQITSANCIQMTKRKRTNDLPTKLFPRFTSSFSGRTFSEFHWLTGVPLPKFLNWNSFRNDPNFSRNSSIPIYSENSIRINPKHSFQSFFVHGPQYEINPKKLFNPYFLPE